MTTNKYGLYVGRIVAVKNNFGFIDDIKRRDGRALDLPPGKEKNSNRIFVHANGFAKPTQPMLGMVVLFAVEVTEKGLNAIGVTVLENPNPAKTPPKHRRPMKNPDIVKEEAEKVFSKPVEASVPTTAPAEQVTATPSGAALATSAAKGAFSLAKGLFGAFHK